MRRTPSLILWLGFVFILLGDDHLIERREYLESFNLASKSLVFFTELVRISHHQRLKINRSLINLYKSFLLSETSNHLRH